VRDETARLSTADHVRARAKLATEHANICAALGWTLEGGVKRRDIGLEIATKMGYHWNSSGRLTDTDLWLTKVVNLGAPDGPALAQCLAILANSLRILGKEPNRQARLATESVTMLRRLGEADALPYALRTLAAVEWERGDIPAARILYDELITTVRDLGDPSTISVALEEVSGFETSHGSLERALQLAGEAHEIATEVGGVGEAGTRHNLACILRLVGRVDEAESMQRQAIPVLLAYDYSYLADVAADYAAILAELGHDDLAARLMGSADGWHELTGVQREDTQTALIAGAIDAARTRLPQEQWEALYQAGHDALVEDELAHALAVVTERSSEASVG
ncbi:MAG TPA: tetratricopeptide repeat protein, partial [Nocardioidaceae bacterium]|nr:tetratricopeptide repeat protein [Nocardioidaceae bacterium]